MPPRKAPVAVVEPDIPLNEEAREAFNNGIKMTVTPRGGEATDLVIRQFYVDQALDVIDQLEVVYELINKSANADGDVDLMQVLRDAKEEVFDILAKVIERDRKTFLGRLEIDDLLDLFSTVFKVNHDFFLQRVQGRLKKLIASASTIL